GQGLKAGLQRGQLSFTNAPDAISFKSHLDRVQQILIPEWLGEELHGSGFHRSDRHWNISMGRDEDDGNVDSGAAQFPLKNQPADSRQSAIENQAARNIGPFRRHELLRRSEQLSLQSYGL